MRAKLNGCAITIAALPLVLSTASVPGGAATLDSKPTATGHSDGASLALTADFQRGLSFRTADAAEAVVEPARLPNGTVKVSSPKGSRTVRESRLGEHDIPAAAVRAYKRSAKILSQVSSHCRLPWTLLAGIGRVESDHGRYAGAELGADGVSRPLIIGVALNGDGPVAAIRDSDGGRFDQDTRWDRAVGPMQFIPTTWAAAGVDGDGDGKRSPNDIDDAALAAGVYLCAGTTGIERSRAMASALHRYNHSTEYVELVMAYERSYRTGEFTVSERPKATPLPELEVKVEGRVIREAKSAGKAAAKSHGKTAGISGKRPKQTDRQEKADTRADSDVGGPSDSQTEGSSDTDEPKQAPTDAEEPKNGDNPRGGDTDPKPKPDPKPNPKPDPKPEPQPDPKPEPEPEPVYDFEPLVETGLFEECETGYCLDGNPLNIGDPADEEWLATPAVADFDFDGTLEDNATEFAGLVGTEVTLLVDASGTDPEVLGWVVYVVNELEYRWPDDTFAVPAQ